MSDTLIVVPVRAGSKGIPNKATRPLGGVSPVLRTIRTAQAIDADVVVTGDDHAALRTANQSGAATCHQPAALSLPGVPLDAPVHFATQYMERLVYPKTYRTVVTLQVTSPFTKRETVERAIQISQDLYTTVLTVRDDRGLRWESALPETTVLTSRAPRRVTRQAMPACWRETGAIFVTPRRWVEPTSRFSHTAYLVEVTGMEAVDLDTMEDWWIAERYAAIEAQQEPITVSIAGIDPDEIFAK